MSHSERPRPKLARRQNGFTLVEVIVALAVFGMISAGIGGAFALITRTVGEKLPEIALLDQLRSTGALIKDDVGHAESFKLETSPTYLTLRWRDQSTFPPTPYRMQYFWEDSALVRQLYVNEVAQAQLPLLQRVNIASDVSFTVTTQANAFVPTSNVRTLSATITVTTLDFNDIPILTSTTVEVQLRPEQTAFLDYLYLYLRNNPTPPVGNTASQLNLPLNTTASTAATLFNYDTDRDATVGLRILRADSTTITATQFQEWVSTAFPTNTQISGSMRIGVFAAAQSFVAGKNMMIVGLVKSLNPSTSATTEITGQVTAVFNTTSNWLEVTIQLPTVNFTIPAGHKLIIRLQFATNSGTEGMVAYDTTTFPSYMVVPVIAP